ncbi:MAG: sodium:calcium antiporter, partial [Pseudomonadota bacterium]|nr:sodium:calcium antiporter [Pseudomonadota bacterium]
MTLALLLLSGITLLLLGGHYLVRHAVELAAKLNVPPLVIGLTIVAFGTSAPELVISVGAAAWNRHTSVGIGNVIGSSIFNLLGIAGVTALVSPI